MDGEPTGSRQKRIQDSRKRKVLGQMCSDLQERMGIRNPVCPSGSGAKKKVRCNCLSFLDEVRGRMGQSLNV